MPRATVRQVVPVDRRYYHILKTQILHGLSNSIRLVAFQVSARIAGSYGAEPAMPGADSTHDHNGGRFL
jgi:hypothetical protein